MSGQAAEIAAKAEAHGCNVEDEATGRLLTCRECAGPAERGAIPPDVDGPVPCHLAPGHERTGVQHLCVEVTIETTTTEKAVIDIDWADFWEWSGPTDDLDRRVKEYLRAGDEWEVCSQAHEASRETPEIVDCEVRTVRVIPPGATS